MDRERIVDFLLATALIFFLWLAAKKTKKLLKRLEPDEKLSTREMIIIKKELVAVATHLAEPAEPETQVAAEPELAAVEMPGLVFEVERPKVEAETAPAEFELSMG